MDRNEPVSVRWYYYDASDTVMRCGHCVKDNQVWMYAKTSWIIGLAQDVVCAHCEWCPKKEGEVRPESRKNTKQ